MSTKPTDILQAVRELAKNWLSFLDKPPINPNDEFVRGYRDCAKAFGSELIALADRAEAESQREGQEGHNPVIGLLCDDPDIVARQAELAATPSHPKREGQQGQGLTFDAFRAANVARCVKWHPDGIASWSPSDWLTAVTGELGELASLLKMRNRERDGLPGNKFSPTDKQVADEIADVLTYLDLLAAVLGVDLGRAAVSKFNEVSERVGFPDRIELPEPRT